MLLNWKYLKMKNNSCCPCDTWQSLGQSGDWVNNQWYNRIFVKFFKVSFVHWEHACHGTLVEVREQLVEVSSAVSVPGIKLRSSSFGQVLSHLTIFFFFKKIMEPNGVDPTSNCLEVVLYRMGVVFSSSIKQGVYEPPPRFTRFIIE